jgi:F0F1-type ATP synthase membrane subunit c/vacuolar-type H+-ATPase subunit K
METNSDAELKRGYRQATIIGMAMVFGVLVYALIVEIMRINPGFSREPLLFKEADSIKYVLLGLALIEFFLIRMIRNRFLSRESGQTTKLQTGSFSTRVTKLLITSIVTHALCESIAIYGLVLFFVTRRPFDFYLFMGISLIYFAAYFPRYAQWEEWIREGGMEHEENLGRDTPLSA